MDLHRRSKRHGAARMARWAAITLTALLLVLPVAERANAACARPANTAPTQLAFLDVLNDYRKSRHLRRLTVSSRLTKIAQNYACLLSETAHFSHVGPDGSTLSRRARRGRYSYCTIYENLAFGQKSVPSVLQAWIKSPSHHRALIARDVVEIGFGLAYGPEPGQRNTRQPRTQTYWVLVLARPC